MKTPTKAQVLEAARVRPDMTNVFKILYPDFFEEIQTYSVGERFECNGWAYILASVGFNDSDGIAVRLISLENGSYIGGNTPVYVKEPRAITKAQFEKIAGTEFKNFNRIAL